MVYQALKFGKPEYLRNMLVDFQANTGVTLRHSMEFHRLYEPRFFREAGRRAFDRSAPQLYNKLPLSVKMADNVNIFKRRLKTFLFTDCYNLKNGVIKEDYAC